MQHRMPASQAALQKLIDLAQALFQSKEQHDQEQSPGALNFGSAPGEPARHDAITRILAKVLRPELADKGYALQAVRDKMAKTAARALKQGEALGTDFLSSLGSKLMTSLASPTKSFDPDNLGSLLSDLVNRIPDRDTPAWSPFLESLFHDGRTAPSILHRETNKTISWLKETEASLIANERWQEALEVNKAATQLEREYKDTWLPLSEKLGHKKAADLFRAKGPLSDMPEEAAQFLRVAGSNEKFVETLATLMGLGQTASKQSVKEAAVEQTSPTKAVTAAILKQLRQGEGTSSGPPPASQAVCQLCGGTHRGALCPLVSQRIDRAVEQALRGHSGGGGSGGGGHRRQQRQQQQGWTRVGRGGKPIKPSKDHSD